MSLLIKALEKAEQGKPADDSSAWSLQPHKESYAAGVNDLESVSVNQQRAAKVFKAKKGNLPSAASKQSVLIGLALLLLLVVVGMQAYAYLNKNRQPQIILASPTPVSASILQVPAIAPVQVPATESATISDASTQNAVSADTAATPAAEHPKLADAAPTLAKDSNAAATPSIFAERAANANLPSAMAQNKSLQNSAMPADMPKPNNATLTKPSPMPTPKQFVLGEDINTANAPVKITRNLPSSGVNPVLLAGYLAFNAGDDISAQRNYRQVLQNDVRNVDALLGMAAIAARQERNNDAAGWYGKVLEQDPRNSVAQAAMVSLLAQADPVSSESRIKTLIAQQPEAAYLHAALGNVYAGQNLWPAAQQAYFQAYHFDANNAEYAFNLAVSLDQLSKPALALPYYQRALDLINHQADDSKGSSASSAGAGINRAQLESRIRQLQ